MRSFISVMLLVVAIPAASMADVMRQWRVDAPQTNAYAKFAGGHSFWFANALVPGGGQQYAFSDLGGRLAEVDTNGDGVVDELRLTGRIQSQQTDSFGFDVDVTFVAAPNVQGQLQNDAYSMRTGGLDSGSRSYFAMDASRATLTGIGSSNAGQLIDLFQMSSGSMPFQFGYGVGGVSNQLGFGGAFGFKMDDANYRGDMSIGLTSLVPAPAAVGLGIVGLGTLAGLRRYFA